MTNSTNTTITTASTTATLNKSTNQTFHWQRFKQYSKAHFHEEKRNYFWFFAVISMIYFLILLMLAIKPSFRTEQQMFFYHAGLLMTGSVFAVRYFSALGRGGSALMSLMQPVATFEKWLLALLTILLAYPLLYTLIFEVMTFPMAWLSQQAEILRATQASTPYEPDITRYQLYFPFSTLPSDSDGVSKWVTIYAYSAYLGLTAYALTASIYFKKLPFIKSIALGFALFLLFMLVSVLAFRNSNPNSLFIWVENIANRGKYQGDILCYVSATLLWIIAPLTMIFASYFALKERDI